MKNRSSGQVSAEFMILVALVLIIFIPIFLLLGRAGIESAQSVDTERIGAISQTILDESREIYFLGEGSRQTITLDMPAGIESLMIVNTSDSYEIVFKFDRSEEYLVGRVSEVPLRFSQATECAVEPSCAAGCDCRALEIEAPLSGTKNIELRTLREDGLLVEITVLP